MGKGRSKAKKNSRANSSLQQHRRSGKVLRPPLKALPQLQLLPWLQTEFPDMIWLCMLVVKHGNHGIRIATEFIKCIDKVCEANDFKPDEVFTGELTGLEQIPESIRPDVIRALISNNLYFEGFPWVFTRILSKYEAAPASWLSAGWHGHEEIISANEPIELLKQIVVECGHGQSETATKAKFAYLCNLNNAGKVHIPADMSKEFERYPDQLSEDELQKVRPSIRATYLGGKAQAFEGRSGVGVLWAKDFWRSNWSLFECETSEKAHPIFEESDQASHPANEIRKFWDSRFDSIVERFSVISKKTDPDLFSPDRYEVLTGIVARQIRAVDLLMDLPQLWSPEHGSGIVRTLTEAHIFIRWMLKKADPDIFLEFKNYGRGNLKLYKLQLEEFRDAQKKSIAGLDEQIKYLDLLVNQDIWEEFQDINLGSFGSTTTLSMARAVGMESDYKLYFAPASSRVHGDWSMLDLFVLTRCVNPLHRGHRILDTQKQPVVAFDLIEWVLHRLDLIVSEYELVFNLPSKVEHAGLSPG